MIQQGVDISRTFFNSQGERFMKLSFDIMTHGGEYFYHTISVDCPVLFDIALGWYADITGVAEREVFSRFPHLKRQDIRLIPTDNIAYPTKGARTRKSK